MEVLIMDVNMNNTSVNENENNENQEQSKTFTAEEVAKLIQSETDKRVTAALKTQEKKYQKQLSLAQLDGDERAKAEKDNRIAELEEQLAKYQIEANKSELKSVLSSRGLSAEFADIINIGEDIEEAQAMIDKLDKLFKQSVKSEVEKRLANNSPKGNGGGSTDEITKESVKKMSMAELDKLATEKPEIFNKFFN